MSTGIALLTIALLLSAVNSILMASRFRQIAGQELDNTQIQDRLERDPIPALKLLAQRIRPSAVVDISSLADFVAVWTSIIGIWSIAAVLDSNLIYVLAGILVAGRFRALEELAHFAMHNALFRRRAFGLAVADILSQFPLLNSGTRDWGAMHAKKHHPHVGDPCRDPAFDALLQAGLARRMSAGQFVKLVLHPLTPAGIASRAKYSAMNFDPRRESAPSLLARILAVALVAGVCVLWEPRLLVLVLVPAWFLWLPWFSWLSLLCEHNWFEPARAGATSRLERELQFGKRTKFSGIPGWIARLLIFPIGDTFHLAHSLFPGLHFRYLKQYDALLSRHCVSYRQVPETSGFWGLGHATPGSLSFLFASVGNGSRQPGATGS